MTNTSTTGASPSYVRSADQEEPMSVGKATVITLLFLACIALFGTTTWYAMANHNSLFVLIPAFVAMVMGGFHTTDAWDQALAPKS